MSQSEIFTRNEPIPLVQAYNPSIDHVQSLGLADHVVLMHRNEWILSLVS